MEKGSEALQILPDIRIFRKYSNGSRDIPAGYGPGAAVGTGRLKNQEIILVATDGKIGNPRFPVVYVDVIDLEETYKIALAAYKTIEEEDSKILVKKRSVCDIGYTGNGPAKFEEIIGMNKAAGAASWPGPDPVP